MAESGASAVRLGVIGGSGVYGMKGVEAVAAHEIETPFGRPSDKVIEARIDARTVMFLPRHGVGHRILPSEVNYRANVHALKEMGVTHLLSVSAAGIMTEEIRPGDMVVPDQIFDRTKGLRASTFFGDGIVGHVMFADPFCEALRAVVADAAVQCGATVHRGGTYVCMEGPQFSTRAESHFYRRTLTPSVIGMTGLPEAKLAREAELCYAMLAMGTDYDCWHEEEEDVEIEAVLAVIKTNSETANAIIKAVAGALPETSDCECLHAARHAIITDPAVIGEDVKERLDVLYGRYFRK